jgi:hypothetical protein
MTDQTTPSRRAGLRDEITKALAERTSVLNEADHDELGTPDAVLTILYRQWPWLRAEAEEAASAADPELRRQLQAAISALGHSETENAELRRRVRHLAACIRQGAPWTANDDNIADRIEDALDEQEQPATARLREQYATAAALRRAHDTIRHYHATTSRIRNIDRIPQQVDPDTDEGRAYTAGWQTALNAVRTELVDEAVSGPAATQATERDCLFGRGGRPCPASEPCATCDRATPPTPGPAAAKRRACRYCPNPLCPETCPNCGSPIHDLDAVPSATPLVDRPFRSLRQTKEQS